MSKTLFYLKIRFRTYFFRLTGSIRSVCSHIDCTQTKIRISISFKQFNCRDFVLGE